MKKGRSGFGPFFQVGLKMKFKLLDFPQKQAQLQI